MSGTICIVDDEPSILHTLSSILEEEGYQVTVAQTGQEALNVIQQEPPDLVLLDIWLSDTDGLEVFERVREQFPNMMVIMMSGYGSVETGVKAIKLGAYDYLEKPLDLEKVAVLVRNAMNERKLEEENLRCRPKIFDYATKELSQDAMICWLLKWSEQGNQSRDEALHDCGVWFVHALLKKHGRNLPSEIEKVEIYRQESVKQESVKKKLVIDVLARINDKHVLLIEDKTGTKDHDNQLSMNYNAVIEGKTKLGNVAEEDLYPIYLKTGNQSLADDQRIEKIKNYKVFNRVDFLNVLSDYAGHNSLLVDFRQHLQDLENQTNSYVKWAQSDKRNNGLAWQGFYRCLESLLFEGTQPWNGWGYVHIGDFLGFWWRPSNGHELYLQIQTKPGNETNLYFRVDAGGRTGEERRLREYWCERVKAVGGQRVVKPKKMGKGNTMAVACWKDEWLAFGMDGKLDLSNTVENLKQAESVWKEAIAQ